MVGWRNWQKRSSKFCPKTNQSTRSLFVASVYSGKAMNGGSIRVRERRSILARLDGATYIPPQKPSELRLVAGTIFATP